MVDKLVHVIKDDLNGFSHALEVNGMVGSFVGFIQIAINGEYCASTQYYQGVLPEFFKMIPIDSNDVPEREINHEEWRTYIKAEAARNEKANEAILKDIEL